MLDVLVARPVIGSGLDVLYSTIWGEMSPKRMSGKFFPEHIGKSSHAEFIVRISNIQDPPIALAICVFDDSEETVDTIPDIGEAALLPTAVNQTDRRAFHHVQDELGDHPRTADPGGL